MPDQKALSVAPSREGRSLSKGTERQGGVSASVNMIPGKRQTGDIAERTGGVQTEPG